jgi:hypothetical protein
MNNYLLDVKVLALTSMAITFQFTQVENTLKIIALVLTIVYTIRRWYLLEKNKKE